jgi:outer membrane biosynthesis protein TonB
MKEIKIMKLTTAIRIFLLTSLLGGSGLIYAQDHPDDAKPAQEEPRPEATKPVRDEAAPPRQEEVKPPKQDDVKPPKDEDKPAKQDDAKPSKQAEKAQGQVPRPFRTSAHACYQQDNYCEWPATLPVLRLLVHHR